MRYYDDIPFTDMMAHHGITPVEDNEDGIPVVTCRKIAVSLGVELMKKYQVGMAE